MRRRLSPVLGPLIALLVSGCAALEEPSDPELTVAAGAAPCIGCPIPAIIRWDSRMRAEDYVPPGTTNIQTLITQGDSRLTFYAWGMSDGRVLYIHRALKRDFTAYMGGLTSAWTTIPSPTGSLSHVIFGSISSPPPRNPPQPGQPPFSQAYGDLVTTSGFDQQQELDALMADLAVTP